MIRNNHVMSIGSAALVAGLLFGCATRTVPSGDGGGGSLPTTSAPTTLTEVTPDHGPPFVDCLDGNGRLREGLTREEIRICL